jgi:hypothetical protein
MSDYSHEVFVSYCRQQRWTLFVRDQFVPRLCQHLHGEIAREDVFFDETSIGVGAAWEEDIREALCRSKVMIAFLSAAYFESEWCLREMAIMLERANLINGPGPGGHPLLIPVKIADGHHIPPTVKAIQYADWIDYADPDLPPASERAFRFGCEVRQLVQSIASSLVSPPPWSHAWRHLDGTTVLSQLAPPVIEPKLPNFV